MNNKISATYLILIITSFLPGCHGPVKDKNENNASASSVAPGHSAGEKYVIDTKESVVTWKGSMLISSDEEHAGYVYISKGELMVEKGQLAGGTVQIDMNTIEYKDREHKNSPVQHLKSPDFFDVEKFPISTFGITGVAPGDRGNIKVTGNLTIKGITLPVNFPAQMEVKDGIARASGKLIIDRTDWGIRYKSGKFYDILADQIISDEIEFHIGIVAKK